MRKSKTLRLLVTLTVPVTVDPKQLRKDVRNRLTSNRIRAKKVVPATKEQFEKEIT